MTTPRLNAKLAAPGKARLEIYDDIGPSWAGMIDASSVSRQLADLGDVSEIEVRINSRGGSAFDGVAISNLLRDHKASVTAVIDGVAASAASVIAMGADKIRMPSNAMMMIHDPITYAYGGAEELNKAVNMLETVKNAAVETYVRKTGLKAEDIAAFMTAETWWTGKDAVAAGMADETGEEIPESEMASANAQLSLPQREGLNFRNAPENWRRLVAMSYVDTKKSGGNTVTTNTQTTVESKAETTPAAPTEAQLAAAREQGAKEENERSTKITALCQTAGFPQLADGFIKDRKHSVEDVRQSLFDKLCKDRAPIGDEGNAKRSGADMSTSPEDTYKAEYAANEKVYSLMGVSLEQYVLSRKKDAGK